MRVIHIITGLSTGGAERALYNLLSGGLAEHFNNHIISLSDEGTIGPQISALGVPVTTLGMRGGRPSLTGLIKLRRAVRLFKPDVIQGWMYHGNVAASVAKRFLQHDIPVIWNIRHSLYNLRNEKFSMRQIIRLNCIISGSVDKIIYNSHVSRTQHENTGFSKLRSVVIPNGFNLDRWKPDHELRNFVRRNLGIDQNTKLVGHFARYHPMKNHAMFLSAIAKVCINNKNIHFLMAGKGVNTNNELLMSDLKTSVTNQAHFLGERSDIEELMPALDLLCLSSSWGEAFPNVLGEAMACNVPCVTTDIGDSKNIVGEFGAVVPPGDSTAMANAILLLLSNSNAIDEENQKLRMHIQNNYSLSVIVNRYGDLYHELMSEKY